MSASARRGRPDRVWACLQTGQPMGTSGWTVGMRKSADLVPVRGLWSLPDEDQ
jgi:hypothetical protein